MQKGFIERRGDKKTKYLCSTDKGNALVTVVPEQIQSPSMTALLRCPKCKSEFVQFLREPQTAHECRKCGAKIPLDALARFEFTCPVCKKESYGRTNVEDAEIVNEKFSCVCGRSIPKLTWNPAKRCYTT